MARLPYLEPDELTADSRALLDRIGAARGEVFNVYRALATSPTSLAAIYTLADALWNRSALPIHLQETTILRVSQLTGSEYEWARHRPIARRVGVPDTAVAALGQWETAPGFDDTQRAVLRLTEEIVGHGAASEATLAATTTLLGAEATVDAVVLISFYRMMASVLASLDVDVEPGSERLGEVG
jgi:alkylhydroperoxidase family enzyme